MIRPRILAAAAVTAAACLVLLAGVARADDVVGKWNRIVLDAMVTKRIGEKMVRGCLYV